MEFEWDIDQEKENIQKHGISFDIAKFVFNDNYSIEIYDKWNSVKEDRFNIIGLADNLLFVVFTEQNDKTCIISARLATETERSLYNDYNVNAY
jgi:hypothetical protein